VEISVGQNEQKQTPANMSHSFNSSLPVGPLFIVKAKRTPIEDDISTSARVVAALILVQAILRSQTKSILILSVILILTKTPLFPAQTPKQHHVLSSSPCFRFDSAVRKSWAFLRVG
jgi:hypothetical protein